MSYACPHCHLYPLEDYIWWVPSRHGDVNKKKKKKKKKKKCNWWCGACGGQHDWRNRNRILVIQESTDRVEAKFLPSARSATWSVRQLGQRISCS